MDKEMVKEQKKILNMDKDKEVSDIIMFLFKAYLFVLKTIIKKMVQ